MCHITTTSFSDAASTCALLGARLCGKHELEAGLVDASQCQLDNVPLWSRTLCGDGQIFISVAGQRNSSSCVDKTELHSFACCADGSGQRQSDLSCDELSTLAVTFGVVGSQTSSKPDTRVVVTHGPVSQLLAAFRGVQRHNLYCFSHALRRARSALSDW